MSYLTRITLFVAFLFVLSCEQKAAEVVYKGHLYFTKGRLYNHTNFDLNSSATSNNSSNKNKSVIAAKSAPNQIVVKTGDTLYSIARKNKLAIRGLIEHNNLKPPYTIYPGNVLYASSRKTHLVKSGENLTRLSVLYGVSLTELATVNNFSRNYKIKTGEILILPYNANLNVGTSVPTSVASKKVNKKSKKTAKKTKVTDIAPVTFTWPVSDGKIIEKFGPKSNGVHNDGINIKATFGSPIKSAAKGKVVYVGSELRGYGNLIIIKHPNNWLTAYAHNNETYVAKDQKVAKGEVIATVGSTGNVEVPQLHFGLRKGRKAVNPQKYIKDITS